MHGRRRKVCPSEEARGAIPADFLGFSYETPVLAQDYFDVQNKALMRLLSNLGTGVLPFGRNSFELSYWSRKDIVEIRKACVVITPRDLDRLFAFSGKTGWPVMLGLNLGHYDAQMAADEAAYAVRQEGKDLLALEVGNEPDLFVHNGHRRSTWGYSDFRTEFQAYLRAIRSRSPDAPVSGPVTCCKAALKWFSKFLPDEGPQLIMATFHSYPISAPRKISPDSPRYPTTARLLRPEFIGLVATETHQPRRDAGRRHLTLRMAEVNSASSGGKNGVSNVFAAEL